MLKMDVVRLDPNTSRIVGSADRTATEVIIHIHSCDFGYGVDVDTNDEAILRALERECEEDRKYILRLLSDTLERLSYYHTPEQILEYVKREIGG